MSLLNNTKDAMEAAVQLINELGVSCTYYRKDYDNPVRLKVFIRPMGTLELVGDYRQGDMKVEIDASSINFVPKKYDTILVAGKKFALRDDATRRMVGDETYTYRFIVRG